MGKAVPVQAELELQHRIAHRISVFNHGRVIGTLDPNGADLERILFRLVHADDERRTT